MTEPPRQNEDSPDASEEGLDHWGDDLYPVEEARELLSTFNKALRAFQLYDENNPVYQRFVGNLVEAFRGLWDEVDRLPLAIQEDRLFYHGEEIYQEASRSESLAFLLYKDGIREVVFLPGIEESEIQALLNVLQHARNLRKEEDDLLTLLWTADLDYFRYTYVDLLGEGVEVPERGDGAEPGQLEAVMEGELEEEEEAEDEGAEEGEPGEAAAKASGQVSREDFNPTRYSLDRSELEQLREEMAQEMARDLRSDVLSALFDRLEDSRHDERKLEILSILRGLVPNLLSRGALESAARVLGELKSLQHRDGIFGQEAENQITALLDEVSSPDSVKELVRALEDGAFRRPAVELTSFLRHLRARALEPLLRASELTEVKDLGPLLREAVQGIAQNNQEELISLLASQDPVVVAGAARLVGKMHLVRAAGAVADLLQHPEPEVRLAAVEAARDLKAPSTTGGLPAVLRDPDREVRVAAARALGHLRYAPAASRFRKLIESKAIRQADITEKVAFFESYGQLGDSDAVKLLSNLLNRRGFLGRKEPSEIRAAAALGLGKVGTPEAKDALTKAQDEEDPVIRSAVNRALRGEEE